MISETVYQMQCSFYHLHILLSQALSTSSCGPSAGDMKKAGDGLFNLQLMLLRSDMRPAGIEVMLGTLAAEHWTRPTSRSGNSFRQRA